MAGTGQRSSVTTTSARGTETDAVAARSEIVLVSHELQDRYARLNWNFTALDVVLSGVYRTDVPRRRPATRAAQPRPGRSCAGSAWRTSRNGVSSSSRAASNGAC